MNIELKIFGFPIVIFRWFKRHNLPIPQVWKWQIYLNIFNHRLLWLRRLNSGELRLN